MSTPPLIFDRTLRRARLDRAAPGFSAADFLHARAADDAVERLETILRDFPLAVDLGAKTGAFARKLSASSAAARVGALIEMELSPAMLAAGEGRSRLRLVADEERLPFAPESLNLAVSLLSLHTTNDLVGALIQIRRSLKPDGLFLGAFLGGATLTELRQSLLEAEDEISGGSGPRVFPFADGFDGAGLLQRAGFTLPVSDVDRVTVRYDNPLKLMADLRAMGETNILHARPRKPLTRAVLARTFEIYVERFGSPDGRIPATFEIISLTGWAAHESQQTALKPGSAKMRLADALGVHEHRAPR
ncbi:MAG: methyltransferase domain-containing protein [Caulobacteraceae bacterium]